MVSVLLRNLESHMFSSKNMVNYNKINYSNKIINKLPTVITPAIVEPAVIVAPTIVAPTIVAPVIIEPIIVAHVVAHTPPVAQDSTSFTPFQKDKLFWCFYVLLNGFTDYEMHRTGHYAIEKAFKISSVEKLRTMKPQIKELKLKINEVEDELVNKEQITVKALQVLCLVYKVSVTYIYGKQYCEFHYADMGANEMGANEMGANEMGANEMGADTTDKTGIIRRNDKKEHALLYEEVPDLKSSHWYIENVQKPLKAPTAYTVKELQDIAEKLEIQLTFKQKTALGQVVEKNKLKKELYEDILQKLL